MRRAAIAGIAAALVLPAVADAHSSSWFWNRAKAESRLEYSSYGRTLSLISAGCIGKGGSLADRSNAYAPRLYQHFDCYLNTRKGRYYGILHVLDKNRFLFTLED